MNSAKYVDDRRYVQLSTSWEEADLLIFVYCCLLARWQKEVGHTKRFASQPQKACNCGLSG